MSISKLPSCVGDSVGLKVTVGTLVGLGIGASEGISVGTLDGNPVGNRDGD